MGKPRCRLASECACSDRRSEPSIRALEQPSTHRNNSAPSSDLIHTRNNSATAAQQNGTAVVPSPGYGTPARTGCAGIPNFAKLTLHNLNASTSRSLSTSPEACDGGTQPNLRETSGDPSVYRQVISPIYVSSQSYSNVMASSGRPNPPYSYIGLAQSSYTQPLPPLSAETFRRV